MNNEIKETLKNVPVFSVLINWLTDKEVNICTRNMEKQISGIYFIVKKYSFTVRTFIISSENKETENHDKKTTLNIM